MKITGLRIAIIVIAISALIGAVVIGGGYWVYTQVRSKQAQVAKNRATLKEFEATSDAFLRETKERLEDGNPVDGAAERAAQFRQAMGQAAANMTGDDALALRAGERVMGAMQPYLSSYEKAFSAFQTKGGLDPKSLTSRDEIGERLSLLTEFETANQEFLKFVRGFQAQYRAELAKLNFPPAKLDATARDFTRGANVNTIIEIRGTDTELCVAMRGYLESLQTEWGKWKSSEGTVIFENTAAAGTFNTHAEKVQEIAARQAELQQKVLRGRGGSGKAPGPPGLSTKPQ
jgi:hypothetical protein